MKEKDKKYLMKLGKLIVSFAIPLLIGVISSIFTSSSVSTWYITLKKASFNPPNWIFGPVWTLLYILMGFSLFLVWKQGLKRRYVKAGLIIFGIQIFLNFLWSILFFGLQNPLLAFIEIVILWTAILFMIIYFYKVKKTAAYAQIPYILWVSFAALLNLSIVLLN
ncbi:tryptophan-rich sensory protein [Candidatus Woesearchaeota archaeon]|nr:tryptophan-rich sensory protein [Candidatus Woesearchaeota archaeon]